MINNRKKELEAGQSEVQREITLINKKGTKKKYKISIEIYKSILYN